MKKRILSALFMITVFHAGIAQTNNDSLKVKDPLSAVLSTYIELKNALAKDDGNSASINAKELFKAISNVPMDKFTPDQYKVWMKYNEKLSYDAEHIKSTTETEHQREHFVSLSKNMYELIKAFNTNIFTIYYQFCPMANDNKGAYWLSEKEKISNPYMGKQMPGCGSTKETIKTK
jgi:hypothetical protein